MRWPLNSLTVILVLLLSATAPAEPISCVSMPMNCASAPVESDSCCGSDHCCCDMSAPGNQMPAPERTAAVNATSLETAKSLAPANATLELVVTPYRPNLHPQDSASPCVAGCPLYELTHAFLI